MASFADPSDLIVFFDKRRICQLAGDENASIAVGSIATDTVLLAMLGRATEMILAHARKGNRYSEEELQELADSATAGWDVTGMTCDLAYGLLSMRRGVRASDMEQLAPTYFYALKRLEQLANGEEIFARIDGDAHADAGTPRTADLRTQVTSPTLCNSWSQQANIRLLPHSPTTNPYDCC